MEEKKPLCEDLSIGQTYTLRKELMKGSYAGKLMKRKGIEEVKILAFVEGSVSRCNFANAKFLRTEAGPSLHPIWVVNCKECPSYNPKKRETVWGRCSRKELILDDFNRGDIKIVEEGEETK